MNTTKLTSLVLTITLLSTACFGSSELEVTVVPADDETLAFVEEAPSSAPESEDPAVDGDTAAETGDPLDSAEPSTDVSDTDRPCEGGAFPDDDEFRELLCAIQWAQVDLMSAGGEFDTDWTQRGPAAILLYSDDRAAAVAELEAVLAEIQAATPGVSEPDPDVDAADAIAAGLRMEGLQTCMVEVAQLIVEANSSEIFDPTDIDAWRTDAESIEAMVEAGDLVAAEDAVCTLAEEIAAAIEDPSLVP